MEFRRLDAKRVPAAFPPSSAPQLVTRAHFATSLLTCPPQFGPVRLNAEQRTAVLGFLAAPRTPIITPYTLFGPPGTGKTITLVEAVLQLLRGPRLAGMPEGADV